MGQLTWALLLPRYGIAYHFMEASDFLCGNITLIYLVVVISLMYLLIHIWIQMSLIVDPSHYHLSAERFGKEKVLIIQIVFFEFMSHSIDQLVLMLSRGVGLRIRVML